MGLETYIAAQKEIIDWQKSLIKRIVDRYNRNTKLLDAQSKIIRDLEKNQHYQEIGA